MIDEKILKLAEALSRDIDYLNLSTMARNALRNTGIRTVGQCYSFCVNSKLTKLRGIGSKSADEIEFALDAYIADYYELPTTVELCEKCGRYRVKKTDCPWK